MKIKIYKNLKKHLESDYSIIFLSYVVPRQINGNLDEGKYKKQIDYIYPFLIYEKT